jgi:Fe-S oxidoreductase
MMIHATDNAAINPDLIKDAAKTSRDAKSQLEKMRTVMKKYISRKMLSMMSACVHCGLCADACHYYASTGDLNLTPVAKLQKFTDFFNQYFHPAKRRIPFFKGGIQSLEQRIDVLYRTAFENCTICGKCALHCPMGIHTGEMMMLARAMLSSIGRLPSGLDAPVTLAIKEGNYVGLNAEEFIETMEWIAGEMVDDIDDPDFGIPIDIEDADVLFIPHPLEIRDNPFLIMYYIKILHAAGENYTFSSHSFDVVNYAYYQGNPENVMKIARRVFEARQLLRAKRIVMSPCGHGYKVLKWDSERYLGKRHSFPVTTLVEMVDEYIREGRIQLEKDQFEGPITYHDPCNVGRRGGVIQAPRNVIRALTSNFVEMDPYGVMNYCCGGGGGLASTATLGQIRMQMGKAKVDQIRKTGARIVATGCFNCLTQIRSLNETYDLGIEPKNFAELVAGSIK